MMKALNMDNKQSAMQSEQCADQYGMRRAEMGFTLIEVMIAVLIGSIVIAVLGGLFLANTNTFRAVDDTARLQENGRFALQTISRITRQAGFIPVDVLQLVATQNDAYPAGLAGIAGARFVAGADGVGPNASDSLTIAFRGAPTSTVAGVTGSQVVDCAGQQMNAAQAALGTAPGALPKPFINTFYVAQAQAGVAAGNSLWCDTKVGEDGAVTRNELIVGVESFQVLYAVDAVISTPAAGGGPAVDTRDFAPDYFTSANNLTTGGKFNNVLGLQVALVLRGSERSTLDKERTANSKLNVFGAGYTSGNANGDAGAVYTIPSADGFRNFRVITSTINLRNRAA
jgi:type IV pilus assembly protein PilW